MEYYQVYVSTMTDENSHNLSINQGHGKIFSRWFADVLGSKKVAPWDDFI